MADFGAAFQAAMTGNGGGPFAEAMQNAGNEFNNAINDGGGLEGAGDAFMNAMQGSMENGDLDMDFAEFETAMDTMIDNVDMEAMEATIADGGTFGDIMPMV